MMKKLFAVVLLSNLFAKLDACVYLTVSSEPPNMLEINWDCNVSLDLITLFEENPVNDISLGPIYHINRPEGHKGTASTNLTFTLDSFPGKWSRNKTDTRVIKGHCLYWLKAHFTRGSFEMNCFRIEPAWMGENKQILRNLSLPMLFLPGTHNSGSNTITEIKIKRSIGQMHNFVLNQDQSVWNQLVFGIRFLDFRIGYYPGESDPKYRFWINHDVLKLQPLLPVLKDIVEFSTSSPDEIIILDFHRFPYGFGEENASEIHKELIGLIKEELEDLIIPQPRNQFELTLEKIWATKNRLVISYGKDDIVAENPWLWSGVSHKWGNKQTPEALEKFLDKTFRAASTQKKLWAAMAELTPTPLHFLNNKSLRSMAQSVNPLLNKWFSEKEHWKSTANIVATDFFLGNKLIDMAISENLERGRQALGKSDY